MARFAIYKNSVLATLCSIVGYLLAISGVIIAFNEEVAGGIVIVVIGLGLHLLGGYISENKKFKYFIKGLQKDGTDRLLSSSVPTAFQVYNAFPSKKTLAYIESKNPQAAAQIRASLAANKEQSNR